jgi:ATP-dependent Lon protease
MSREEERLDIGDASAEHPVAIPSELPILPLRDTVLFPNSFLPLAVARESSVRLIEEAISGSKLVGVFTQRDAAIEEPTQADLHQIGTATHIHKMFKLPDGSLRLIVQGLSRLHLESVTAVRPYLRARVNAADDTVRDEDRLEIDALQRNIKTNFQHVVSLSPLLSDDLQALAMNITEPGRLADFIASSLATLSTSVKQEVLETVDVRARLDLLNRLLIKEAEVLELGSKIQSQVQSEVGKNQREYFLREQLKAIQKELGEGDDQTKEIEELREKIEAAGMPEGVKKEAKRELDRLSKMPVAAAEYTVSRTYLDWLIALPWSKRTDEVIDLARTKAVLDADHSGLEKAKDRILEYLAVRKLNPTMKGPILCFAGPPGVGKTSLAKSIANSLDRKFVRVSLGGMRDEAEIRGHRRTYIGALPGRVLQAMRKAKVVNPVILLDEVDKMGQDWRGDPAAALLEVLDPEQNRAFNDHYLEVDYDLSQALFITTANTLGQIPEPLRDRMEIIRLPGYVDHEKYAIARKYLIPRQLRLHGLDPEKVSITPEAVAAIARGYTREAGVRELERKLARIARKLARRASAPPPSPPTPSSPPTLSSPRKRGPSFEPGNMDPRLRGDDGHGQVTVDVTDIPDLLGVAPFEDEAFALDDHVGVATGLAYTNTGGDLLEIEIAVVRGRGRLQLTGTLGDVLKESAGAALTYARSRAQMLGIDPEFARGRDIHIHIPAGATPKDGPSAGIAIATALVSALTGVPVRGDTAMTGEVTLRGRVLPIGGLKEKLVAARRSGITRVIIPHGNARELSEVSEDIRDGLEFYSVSTMDQVLDVALRRAPAEGSIAVAAEGITH